MTSEYLKKISLGSQHNILQFVFLLQVEIHMAYMHFEGFYLAHEQKNQVCITEFGQKVLPTFMELPHYTTTYYYYHYVIL